MEIKSGAEARQRRGPGKGPGARACWLVLLGLLTLGCTASESKPGAEIASRPPKTVQPEAAERPRLPAPMDLETRTIILTYHDMVPVRDSKSLWFDCTPKELEEQIRWLRGKGAKFVSLADVSAGLAGIINLPDKAVALCFADNYEGVYKYAVPILKREQIPTTLFVHTGHVGSQQGRPKMTWDQLRELENTGLFSAESQTVSHPEDLTKLSDEALEKEFALSKETLEEQLDRSITMIAYPNGKHNEHAADLAQKCGYLIGFTEDQKPAELAPNLFQVPRYVHTKYREAWEEARQKPSKA